MDSENASALQGVNFPRTMARFSSYHTRKLMIPSIIARTETKFHCRRSPRSGLPACSNRHRSRINTRAAHPRPKGSRSGRQSVPRRVRPSPPSHSFQGSSQIAPWPLHRENCGQRCREPAFRSPGWACVAILARSTSCCPITRGIEWSSGNGYGVGRVQRRQVPRR